MIIFIVDFRTLVTVKYSGGRVGKLPLVFLCILKASLLGMDRRIPKVIHPSVQNLLGELSVDV